MEANNLIATLKANGVPSDLCDLDHVNSSFDKISSMFSPNDKGTFALNILCTLCRNLEKVPNWKPKIDNNTLITLTLNCARETKCLSKPDRVKVLACVYHLHKHAIKEKIPPDLVLKLSHFPFHEDVLTLVEYSKTYWAILADRLMYMEKLKNAKVDLLKLLTKLTDDICKTITIYNIIPFCADVLPVLMKKLYHFYNDKYSMELDKTFAGIFAKLSSKNDIKTVKNSSDTVLYDLYKKLNDCLYIVIENSTKFNFVDSSLSASVKFVITILGHKSDLYHCLQTFYMNLFCNILVEKPNSGFVETVISGFNNSCELTEKLGYDKAMSMTYPYLNQLLRIYIEYSVTNFNKDKWIENFSIDAQECYIKIIILLMKKMVNTPQLVKCENCKIKSGMHDSLRLSFAVKLLISSSLTHDVHITNILQLIIEAFTLQKRLIEQLKLSNCSNIHKYENKFETDVHNIAVSLYKAKYYECSINLLDIYLKTHLAKAHLDRKGITRGFYNKAICATDACKHEEALQSAYLGLILSAEEGRSSDKFMSLVVDVKAKALTRESGDVKDGDDGIQVISVLDVARSCIETPRYGNIKHMLCNIDYCALLKHEFTVYATLWPSLVPVGAVWSSFMDLLDGTDKAWLTIDNGDTVLSTLYEVVLLTANSVRTIHYEKFNRIVTHLLDRLQNDNRRSTQMNIIYGSLLFLKAEYDVEEASQKYGWKGSDQIKETDQMVINQTLPQEHEALKKALQAVKLWTRIFPDVIKDKTISVDIVRESLHIIQVFVPEFLYFGRPAEALQLAYICSQLSIISGDMTSYARNVGVIMYHSYRESSALVTLFKPISYNLKELFKTECHDALLTCVCDAGIHFARVNKKALAARLASFVQAHVIDAIRRDEYTYEMCIGRLMELHYELREDHVEVSTLTHLTAIHRQYMAVKGNGAAWSARRRRSLEAKHSRARAAAAAARAAAALGLWRRARGGAPAAGGGALRARGLAAAVFTHKTADAQVTIDNRLKYIIDEQYLHRDHNEAKPEANDTRNAHTEIETMLEATQFNKLHTSPSLAITSVPGFKMADHLMHTKPCTCHACANPYVSLLTLKICGLEACLYFHSKEHEIAGNYFDGARKMFAYVDSKLGYYLEGLKLGSYEDFVIEAVEDELRDEFLLYQCEILLENAFYNLANDDTVSVDDCIVQIHDLLKEFKKKDCYIVHGYSNLLCAASKIKQGRDESIKCIRTTENLEIEFERLKLSPESLRPTLPFTPEVKPNKPPELNARHIVYPDEIPKLKRKVIKLNLDDATDENCAKEKQKEIVKPQFKIPVPVTKHLPEIITPMKLRQKPSVNLTQSDATNVTQEFFTPLSKDIFSTPDGEQFFTPMSSIKTYTAKKTLRHQVVKKLEGEFSTPKAGKENASQSRDSEPKSLRSKVETGSLRAVRDKRILKRATSPGKLPGERSRRVAKPKNLRPQVNLSPDVDVTQISLSRRNK